MKYRLKTVVSSIALGALATILLSLEGPATYAASTEAPPSRASNVRLGKMGQIDPNTSVVVINDQSYLLSSSARVYAANGVLTNLDALKPGTSVSFTLAPSAAGVRPTVMEIRIVPAN